jgi:hypothetical protein
VRSREVSALQHVGLVVNIIVILPRIVGIRLTATRPRITHDPPCRCAHQSPCSWSQKKAFAPHVFDFGRGRAELIPVNPQQTGLSFEESVEATVAYRFGLFQDSRCCGEDHRRADDLKPKEALIRDNRAT